MKVFVAGATGALGRPLVRQLIEHGHEVTGMTRYRPEVVEELGAKAVVADAFDADGTRKAVVGAAPEALIHVLTRIPNAAIVTPGRLKVNDRLREEGTRNLMAASKEAGVGRVVAESITFAFDGRSEEKMKPLAQMGSFDRSVTAVRSLESQVLEANGIVLRFGFFYGPGTSITEQWPRAMKRKMLPVVGKGTGWWSFIHVEDAASGTVAALERGRPGQVYNIVDDDPILAKDAADFIAKVSGAGKPFRLPPIGPQFVKQYFNEATGASNTKAKEELGWAPKHSTFKEGFPSTIKA